MTAAVCYKEVPDKVRVLEDGNVEIWPQLFEGRLALSTG